MHCWVFFCVVAGAMFGVADLIHFIQYRGLALVFLWMKLVVLGCPIGGLLGWFRWGFRVFAGYWAEGFGVWGCFELAGYVIFSAEVLEFCWGYNRSHILVIVKFFWGFWRCKVIRCFVDAWYWCPLSC